MASNHMYSHGQARVNMVLKRVPTAPKDLDSIARKYWYELGGMLVKEKHLMTIDIPVLRFCCEYYSSALQATNPIERKRCVSVYLQLISKFGATPKSRIKPEDEESPIEIVKVPDDGIDDDDEEWLKDF